MQIKEKSDWINRLSELLIYIFAAECTLGASGRWLSVGPLSIRMIIFIFAFLASLPVVFKQFKDIIRKPICIAALAFGFIILISAANGFSNNNKLSFITSDITCILTLALLPGIIAVINTKEKCNRLLNVVFYSAVAIGILTVLIYLTINFLNIEQIIWLNNLINRMSLGGLAPISSATFRVYLKSQVFIQYACIYGVYKICTCEGKKKYIYALLVGVMLTASIISLTRGFWLGLLASAIIVIILQIKNFKNLLKSAGIISVSFVLVLLVITACYGKPYLIADFVHRFNPNLIVLSGSDKYEENIQLENNDPEVDNINDNNVTEADKDSVNVRAESIEMSIKLFKSKFIFGNGLGKNLDGLRSDGRTEYMYLDYLMKLGIIGFISLLSVYFISCIQYLKKRIPNILNKIPDSNETIRNDCVLASYLGIAITSFFNPFLNTPMGILMLFTVVACTATSNKTNKQQGV